MSLQNFVDKTGPVVSAAWLNIVDALKFTVFGDATTKAAARTALMSDTPLEVVNGGTGLRASGVGIDALQQGNALPVANGGTGATSFSAAGLSIVGHTHTGPGFVMSIRSVIFTTDTPTAADAENMVALTEAAPTVVMLEAGACLVGQSIGFWRIGAGSVTFAPGTSQVINSPGARLTIPEQYGTVVATYRDTNTWILAGV